MTKKTQGGEERLPPGDEMESVRVLRRLYAEGLAQLDEPLRVELGVAGGQTDSVKLLRALHARGVAEIEERRRVDPNYR